MTRVGMCPECRATIALDGRGKVARHPRVPGGNIDRHDHGRCVGSGRSPQEKRDARKEAGLIKRKAAIEAVREEARVVLDAAIEGRAEFDKRLPGLLKYALQEYRLRHPTAKPLGLFVTVPRNRSAWGVDRREDIYCLFCGEHLAANVPGTEVALLRSRKGTASLPDVDDRLAHVERHTTPCALQCLAGMREYANPGTRKLPADAVAEGDAA